jgi:hypothetical protein
MNTDKRRGELKLQKTDETTIEPLKYRFCTSTGFFQAKDSVMSNCWNKGLENEYG